MHLQPSDHIDHVQVPVQVFVHNAQRFLIILECFGLAPKAVNNLPEDEAPGYRDLVSFFLRRCLVVYFSGVHSLTAACPVITFERLG